MDHLFKEINVAIGYHAKSTVNKYDILYGDEKLLNLIIDNLFKDLEYKTLYSEVIRILDDNLGPLPTDDITYQLASEDEVDLKIDQAILKVLATIENSFVRNELTAIALAPKKMLRSKMFLKSSKTEDYRYAAIIELFHLATLIQDDIIDNATTRRHTQTINSKYDDRTALLLSDYLLVHIGYTIGTIGDSNSEKVKATNPKISSFYQELIKDFLRSLLYSEKVSDTLFDLKSYEQYASSKTAKFFKVALISGALVANQDVTINQLEAIGKFGLDFGLLFQKIDDLLDYNADIAVSGKDSRDSENGINNFIILSLKQDDINTIKNKLNQEAERLLTSEYAQDYQQEIDKLIRRINE